MMEHASDADLVEVVVGSEPMYMQRAWEWYKQNSNQSADYEFGGNRADPIGLIPRLHIRSIMSAIGDQPDSHGNQ
jgi:hypothetical protein